MMCFQDRTFCASPDCTGACGRQWTDELKQQAAKWFGGEGAPVMFGYFCGKPQENELQNDKEAL